MPVEFPPSNPPGYGIVELSSNPSQFRTLSYAYPLKLISPSPYRSDAAIIQTLFLLSYGGGLVAGDCIALDVTLDPHSNLILLTQGSTKIFKTPDPETVPLTSQTLDVKLRRRSALCYIPDPVQPFSKSSFVQRQRFRVSKGASLCVCDWVTSGRPARGEIWGFWSYESRNEIWAVGEGREERLLVRDNLVMDDDAARTSRAEPFHGSKVDNLGVYGTLILRGAVFKGLGEFFMAEFTAMPRIGEKTWDDDRSHAKPTQREEWRRQRLKQEGADGVLWTAALVRSCVVVKFGSREVEGSKKWLRSMISEEGSVESYFGERATLCLR